MAKANNSGRTKKSHNYKPYDTPNSFVKRFTAKVSEILPQPSSWVSKLFSPAPKLNVREREELEDEEEEEEERQPPSKKLCFRPPETNDYTHRNNINRLSDLDRESGEISPICNSRLDDERAVPGPSGLHLRNFVSSTPAVRQVVESSPKVVPGVSLESAFAGLVKKTPVADLKKNVSRRSSLNLSSTLNSSQPSFDTFVFKNPLNKSGLRPRSSLNESCFYPGETTYGGSSSRISLPVLDQPKARVVNVTASPSLQRDTIGTSALRILKALEQFSTPVLDAKKIPVRTEGNPRKKKPPQPYEELIFPSMPELLSFKRREVVSKPSTSAEAELQPTSSTIAEVPTTFGLPVSSVPQLSSSASTSYTEYSLRPESKKETHVGSIKGRQKDIDIETEKVPELNLPNVELKITSLPKFDLGNASQEVKPLPPKSKPETVMPCSAEFKFSEPEILEKVSIKNIIPVFPVNTYKFSEPLTCLEFKEKTASTLPTISPTHCPSSENEKELKMKVTPTNFKLKKKSVESSKPDVNLTLKMPTKSETSSIMEVLSKNTPSLENNLNSDNNLKCGKCKDNYDKNKKKCSCENLSESKKQLDRKKSETKWECKKCQEKNESSQLKCKHCSLEKGSENIISIHKGFEGFKKPADTWECKECFVRNKNSVDVCVACSVSKSGKSSSVDGHTTSTSSIFTFSSGGNKTEVTKTANNCISLANSIKKPQGTWECNTCLVQNKVDATSCVACSTPKPGSTPAEKPKPTFSFGIPATTVETNSFQFGTSTNAQKNESNNDKQPQFSFGVSNNDDKKNSLFKFETDKKNDSDQISTAPQIKNYVENSNDKWECNTCLIKNKNDVNSCIACGTTKPGSNAVEKPKPTFSFGMPNTNLSTVNSVQFGSNLNAKKIEANTVQNPFAFDHQLSEKKSESSSLFKFGSSEPKSNNESKNLFAFMNSEKQKENEKPNTPVSNLFSFGSTAKENKLDNENADDNPLKKRVSFGKPAVSDKIFINENTSTIFGNVTSSKSNAVSSPKFNFAAISLIKNNSNASKGPIKESSLNSVNFTFGNAESNSNVKPTISEPAKSIGFNAAPPETANLTNNDHSNLQRVSGGSFKMPEPEKKLVPFSFMGNSEGSQNNQFTFNAVASAPTESFGSQQPASGLPLFNQQQQTPAPSSFNQQLEFLFGAPQQQNTQPLFNFSAPPAQGAGIGGSTPTFGAFAPPSNPTPVFDPNAKPSFNFTGGATPSFSAPTSHLPPPTLNRKEDNRKLRKAIRRTTQNR